MTGDRRPGLPGVSPLLGGSFRRALRAGALRRDELPRTAAPAPAAAGPRRHAPMPRHTSRARPSRSRRVRRSPCEGHSHRAGTCRALSGSAPLQRQGHPKILSKRFAEKDLRDPPLSAGDLCQPSGPDGEGQAGGQARNMRGEPFAHSLSIKTRRWQPNEPRNRQSSSHLLMNRYARMACYYK